MVNDPPRAFPLLPAQVLDIAQIHSSFHAVSGTTLIRQMAVLTVIPQNEDSREQLGFRTGKF
jgi:hypothetical protein